MMNSRAAACSCVRSGSGSAIREIKQCSPKERKLIAAIIDTILDQHRQEDTPDEKA